MKITRESIDSLHVVKGLVARSCSGFRADNGRVIEAFLEPIMFLVLWGMVYTTGLIQAEVSKELLIINLIWATSASIQKQASLSFMYDVWSREFTELLRAGVKPTQYLLAILAFGVLAGVVIVVLYCLLSPFIFRLDLGAALSAAKLLPALFICGLTVSCFGVGVVLRYSQLYGFVASVILQVMVLLANPFVPRESLPTWWQWAHSGIPFTWVFEAVRDGAGGDVTTAYILSLLWFGISIYFYFSMFRIARRDGRLARI